MTEYDLNGNGKIDPIEHEIMLEDRRRSMEDADAKRDTQRRLTTACAAGMLLGAYFGFNAMEAKK